MRAKYVGKESEYVLYGVTFPRNEWVDTDVDFDTTYGSGLRANAYFEIEGKTAPFAAWALEPRNPSERERG